MSVLQQAEASNAVLASKLNASANLGTIPTSSTSQAVRPFSTGPTNSSHSGPRQDGHISKEQSHRPMSVQGAAGDGQGTELSTLDSEQSSHLPSGAKAQNLLSKELLESCALVCVVRSIPFTCLLYLPSIIKIHNKELQL